MTPPAIPLEKSSIVPNAQTRARRRLWMEVTAALILSLCFAQRGTAEAATIQVNTTQQ